ncbi:hypothetical protein QYF36_011552 [Acer negundo]|nr:hypothetical protein QYF36_011552 [Acer negundo]
MVLKVFDQEITAKSMDIQEQPPFVRLFKTASLPFVMSQSKSRPQGWPLRRRETIGCQLRGVVAFLVPPPGIFLRSVVTIAVIVASTPRDFVELASKKTAIEISN